MHAPAPRPSPRLAAALLDAIDRAAAARATGDRDGARYADAERRAILRRLTRSAAG
jgi:hypothetical protein